MTPNREVLGEVVRRAESFVALAADGVALAALHEAGQRLGAALARGSKILTCGNGGSAAEAQHFAGELTGRFKDERVGLAAFSLTADTVALTAIANDYGYGRVFSRQIQALGKPDDVLVVLTTSDALPGERHSANILGAIEEAKASGMEVIGLFSEKTAYLVGAVDVAIQVPSRETAIIQEMHLAIIHILCGMIDAGVGARR